MLYINSLNFFSSEAQQCMHGQVLDLWLWSSQQLLEQWKFLLKLYIIFLDVCGICIYVYVVYMKMHTVHICMCVVSMHMCVHIYACV